MRKGKQGKDDKKHVRMTKEIFQISKDQKRDGWGKKRNRKRKKYGNTHTHKYTTQPCSYSPEKVKQKEINKEK